MGERDRRSASLLDVYIARRLRARRLQLGLSQQDLAERAQLTVQQIHKYEHGLNRISASRLADMARLLDTPLSDLYAGVEALRRLGGEGLSIADPERRRDICDLLIAYVDAAPGPQRRRILELVYAAVRGQQLRDRARAAFQLRPVRPIRPARRVLAGGREGVRIGPPRIAAEG